MTRRGSSVGSMSALYANSPKMGQVSTCEGCYYECAQAEGRLFLVKRDNKINLTGRNDLFSKICNCAL